MRRKIYQIIDPTDGNGVLDKIYDGFMMVVILVSLLPLCTKEITGHLLIADKVCAVIFIIDYILRWITADYKFERGFFYSFIRYPFSMMAIFDLLSILPTISLAGGVFRVLKVVRMIRFFRVFRIFRLFRYSKSVRVISQVFKKTKGSLAAVVTLAAAYIWISALIVFTVEPDTFSSFFDAIYWATISLTTVGYGDIYPVTLAGRVVTMLSSLFGVAVVALPAGIITAGYMQEIEESDKEEKEEIKEETKEQKEE